MNRTWNVVRLQLINRQTYIWVPLIVLAGSLLVSLAIYGLIRAAGVPEGTVLAGGGAQAPLWYFLAVGIQALTLSFPFSQAMSVTRREFYLGTLLTAAMTSAGLAIIFVVGGYVEEWTNGWGLGGSFFRLAWIWEQGPLAAGFFYFVIALLFFMIGFWCATIYKRFGSMMLTLILVGFGFVLIGIAFLLTRLEAWAVTWEYFVALGAGGLALYSLVAVALLAVGSYLTLRRAIP